MTKREGLVKSFQEDGDVTVAVLSVTAVGTGLNSVVRES